MLQAQAGIMPKGAKIMSTLYVRNFPDHLYEQIRESAAKKRRSMAAEVVVLVEEALQQEASIQRRLDALDRIRERSKNYVSPPGAPDSLTDLREDRNR
jgi:plasmid stability protein